MNLITCENSRGGGNSLELGVGSEELGVKSEEVRVKRHSSFFNLHSSLSLILSIALLFGASSAWAADWTDAEGDTYTALKYIKGKATAQATGGGWFVLPIKPKGTDIVKMRFKLATTEWTQFLWCNRAGSSLAKYPKFGAYFSVAGYVQCQRNTGNTAGNTNPGTGECSIEVNYNTLKFYVNGTEQSSSLVSDPFDPPAANTMLFASNIQTSKSNTTNYQITDNIPASNVSNRGSYYLYDFQIYDSATNLTHNIVPAMRETDHVTGLYDTVTRTFYTKAKNSGDFDAEEWGTDRAGKKWTGAAGDGRMSTAENWENNEKPSAGDDIDFTIAVPLAPIVADIKDEKSGQDVTFGKIYLGTGDLPAFSGALCATGINDLERMTAYNTATDGFAFTLAAPSAQDLIWNGEDTANWNATDKSWLCNGAPSAWYDHNNAVFNADGAKATLTEPAAPDALVFSQSATVAGSATLTVPTVSVAEGVAASISAPTSGALEKTGAGMLTLASSRDDQTTLSEGTLAMLGDETTFDWSKFTLGTDPAKPVILRLENGAMPTSGEWRLGRANITSTVVKAEGDWSRGGYTIVIGNAEGADTTFIHEDGSLTCSGYLIVGGSGAANSTMILSGGSITNSNTATGSTAEPRTTIGYISDGTLIVTNGASLAVTGQHLGISDANGVKGIVEIYDGSTIDVANAVIFGQVFQQGWGEGKLNLHAGGTLATKTIRCSTKTPAEATAEVNFDGGTLKALSSMNIIQAHDHLTVNVSEKGGTIDNNGKDISIEESFNGTGTIKLTGSGTTTFAAGVGAEGGVSVANGTTLTINGTAQSSFGSLTLAARSTLALSGVTQSSLGAVTLEAGSSIDIATPATDVAAFAATTLNLPAKGTVTLTSGGGAFGEGLYAICEMSEMSGVTVEDVKAKFVPLIPAEIPAENVEWSIREADNTLMLAVGAINPNTWTGGANNGNLSDPKNWRGGAVPESGTVTINTTGTLTVGDKFNPDVIVFPETCGDITISGENSITGIMAITNLSSSTCTFAVPVSFANKIDVHQTASYYSDDSGNEHVWTGGHVSFPGGVTGSSFAEGTSHMLDGAYFVPATADWQANNEGERLWGFREGSSLTIAGSSSETPAPTNTSMLLISPGAALTTGVMRTSSRLSYRVYGEYVVTNELEVALTKGTYIAQRYSAGGKYKFEKLTLSDSGTSDGYIFWLANSTTSEGAAKQVYIGAGGVSINAAENKNTALSCGTHASDVTHLYPWHSDYAINGKGGSTRDLIIFRATNLYTDDENGVARTVTLNGVADVRAALTVKGSGRFQVNSDGMNGEGDRIGDITVTDSATLAFASGADLGVGAVTVGANATMEVASGAHTFEGGLTLNDGATLAFNFTKRTIVPQIAIAAGKELTVKGAVNVKIPVDSKWPTGGEKILTTCGGFTAEKVTLVDGAPKWVRGLSVNADGNIVLNVKPMGTKVIVR